MRLLDGMYVLSVGLTLGFGAYAQDARSAPRELEARTSSSIAPNAVANPRRNRIAAGAGHTCALTKSDGLKCWGSNYYGQIGDGSREDRLTAVPTKGLPSGLSSVTAGVGHTCVLTKAGGIKCWGWGPALGDGVGWDRYTPGFVKGFRSGAIAVVSGNMHVCALTKAGGVKCWGYTSSGQFALAPVAVKGLTSGIIALAAAGTHTCALTKAGVVKCWGQNDYGQLGDGTTTDRLTPVAVKKLAGIAAIAGANGYFHTCALTGGGVPLCWGYNLVGQLGDGTTTDRHTPVRLTGLAGGVKAISLGGLHTCALLNSGGVRCWGYNFFGQLGDNTLENRRVPTPVYPINATALAAGGSHTCALTPTGGAKCWGHNDGGQLGIGTKVNQKIPVSVKNF